MPLFNILAFLLNILASVAASYIKDAIDNRLKKRPEICVCENSIYLCTSCRSEDSKEF